ncbi:MAG: DUF2779 domain-containing protein [Tenericutes bacterium]|jgi:hypothetical protein|nr:DUF2779 domain-containing protein [Mycoplasmatota bacterium]
MIVTSNKLFNYIRCRRFASLHDGNVETDTYKNDDYYHKGLSKFKDIFLGLNYIENMSYEKDINLTYDFHHDFTLSENFDFIFNEKDIYVMITESSKHFIELKYKQVDHTHQLFNKDNLGHYKLEKHVKNSENYNAKLKKMMSHSDLTGQVILKYAFMQYLYKNIYPNKHFNIYVVMLNEDYIHDGLAFNQKLYHIFDFSNIDDLDNQLEISLFRMINHIELNDFTPCELVKNACLKGKEMQCKFVDFCYGHLPEKNSILDYYDSHLGFKEPLKNTTLHHNTYELLNEGYIKMEDIPLEWLTHKNRLMQRYCLDNDIQYINKEKVSLMLDRLEYPLTYLDISLMPTIIPKFKGERPFEKLGFQYSIYYQHTNETLKINDEHFINSFKETRTDTRTAFAERFADHLLEYDKSIIVYNKPRLLSLFESIKVVFPTLEAKFAMIAERLVDILDILEIDAKYLRSLNRDDLDLSTNNFYNNRLSGTYSRKNLAEVFKLEEMNDLSIHDDETEYKTFRLFNDYIDENKQKAKNNMILYSQYKAYLLYKIIKQLNETI